MKTCSKCGTSQPVSEFRPRADRGGRLRSHCRGCEASQIAGWRARNADHLRAHEARRYSENREQRSAAHKQWRDANLERSRERTRTWKAANPLVARAHEGRRRAAKRAAATETISAAQIDALIEEFNGLCGYCSAPWEHLDHYIPLARGGRHTIANLVPACAACNLSKGAKLPVFEWISRPDLFKEVRPVAL